MNPLYRFIVATSVLAAATSASAAVHRITFDQPFVLTGAKFPTSVELIKRKLDRKTNQWKEEIDRKSTRLCDATIRIEGRDIALKKQILGEHYFGTLELSCDSESGFFIGTRSAFKTTFSRVLFLGIRECVQSETMVDQDYCSLVAFAMRRESDVKAAHGDLVDSEEDERRFYRLSSPTAKATAEKNALVPDGLNASTIDSYQLFKLSIGKTGREFMVQGTSSLSSFSQGQNLYLQPDASSATCDEGIITRLDAAMDALEKSVRDVQVAGNPRWAFDQAIPTLLSGYARAAKLALSVVSPVDFYRLDGRIKKLEQSVVELSKAFNPDVKDRSTFVQKYAAQFDEFNRVSGYFNQTQPTEFKASSILTGAAIALPQSTARDAPTEPRVGEEFLGSYSEPNYQYAHRYAFSEAQSECNAYLRRFPSVMHRFTCEEQNHWKTSSAYYSQMAVKRLR